MVVKSAKFFIIPYNYLLLTMKQKVCSAIELDHDLELKKLYYNLPIMMVDGSIKYESRELSNENDSLQENY